MTTVRSWERFDAAVDAVESGIDDGLVKAAENELDAAETAYDKEETVLGTPWTPLAPYTIWKKGHDTILVETGEMRDSGFVEEKDDEVRVGFSDWKVPIHEFGTEDIPARPIVGPMRDDLRQNRLRPAVADSIEESLSRLSFTEVSRL